MIVPKQTSLLLLISVLAVSAQLAAQVPAVQPQYQLEFFNFQEVMIPMRDGVRLQTVILTPKLASGPLPILLQRELPTAFRKMASASTRLFFRRTLVADGYIFVFQNIRGRFKSEGHSHAAAATRQERFQVDGRRHGRLRHIDWLIKNVPNNNGRVGIWGISYPGWLVTQALLEPHPALKAASEQASPDDMFINDDFHHNGAFRLSYGFEYSALLETSKEKNTNFEFDQYDTYSWYLFRSALECKRPLFPRKAAHVERLRRASQSRFLEAARGHGRTSSTRPFRT